MMQKNGAENLPMVSVIVPMRNEEEHIGQCLQSIVHQNYPIELMEVLIIDGMSDDSSREIVGRFTMRHSYIRLLSNSERATACALNRGIKESKGEIIIRVDAHCVIDRDYVQGCVKALRETGAENVGGLMKPTGRTFLQKAIALAMCSRFGIGSGKFHYCEKDMFVDTVYLGAYPRQVFERIGCYDQDAHYGEDDELNYRLIKNGGRIFLSQKIKSEYYPRSSLSALWRQYYHYGCGKVRTIKKHGRLASLRHLVPSGFVLSIIGSLVLYAINSVFGWLVIASFGSYLLSAIFVSATTSFRRGPEYFLALPIVFGTLHLSYGMGFIVGVVRVLFHDRTLQWQAE